VGLWPQENKCKTKLLKNVSKNKKKTRKNSSHSNLRTLSKAMGDQQPESRADGPADVGEGEGMGQSQQPDIAMGLMCLFQPVVEQIDLSVQGENKCLCEREIVCVIAQVCL
jgi:hypothetical protein